LYTRYLVITEKPSSARKIAYAIDDFGSPRNAKIGKVTFYTANRAEAEIVVVSAVGHLFSIEQEGRGWTYPMYDIKWVPTYKQNKRAYYTKQYLDAIIGLSENVNEFISACDYDQEGSLIAYNILKYGIGEKALFKSKRMLYSTLTSKDLISSWKNLTDTLDFKIIAAGKTRHEIDWLFGINLSRALTIAYRRYSGFKTILSTGRVQGPTLKFVYDQEQYVRSFIPIPYWKVYAETLIDEKIYPLEFGKPRLDREEYARNIGQDCRGKIGTVTRISSEKTRTFPPTPFSLSDLQRESYNHFKMNPSMTLKRAETLYLGAYISYPRTESNKIPSSIDVKNILENLSNNNNYKAYSHELINQKRFKPRPGKGCDPAHPAIHPTGQNPRQLKKEEQRVYDLIVKRFFASLARPLVQLKTDVTIDVNKHIFYLRGISTHKQGWTRFYSQYYNPKDKKLPVIKKDQRIPITKLSTRRKYTKSSPRYNPSSLIRKMEQEKIGTKSTRSNIVDTLYQRGYIKGNSITLTPLGEKIVDTLEQYCPEIIKVKLTRDLEKELEEIATGEKPSDSVLNNMVNELKPVLYKFKENEEKIGRSISNDTQKKELKDYINTCKICQQEKIHDSVFCRRHKSVYDKIETTYQQWRYIMGYQWVEYLEKIAKIYGTGDYVKEVIDNILG
jgi:DNA topoisomerase-1